MTAEARATGGPEGSGREASWRVFGMLLAATVVCSLIILPYVVTLLDQDGGPEIPAWALAAGTVIQSLVLTAVAAGLGLWLGPKVGLGAPDLRGWVSGSPAARQRIRAALPLSAGLGLATGGVILLVGAAFMALLPGPVRAAFEQAEVPSPWQGFLASISAGVNEEIWLRLGLVTVLVFLGARLLRQGGRPSSGTVWISIALATLIFGALHLPQAVIIAGGLPAPLVAYILLLNGLAGLVFGWLYWRRGLVAAMVAHFSADIVLHVVAPAFTIATT